MITRYLKSPLWYGVGDSIVGQVRKANEDSCGYQSTPNGELFVVCDGMGGHVGGATASRIAVESIISYLSQQAWSNKPKAIEDALRFANTQILGTAANDPSLKGMGTTACIVLCEEQNVWIGHVGDSRIYLFVHKDKSLHRITKDHSYVQVLVDKGEIDDRQAENHPQKNIIMRALGSKEDVIPEVEQMPVQVTRGDTFLICSDGLSGMIDDNEIEKILTSDISLEDKAEKLINDANAPGKGKDNITVQLVQAMNDNPKATVFPDFNPQWRKRIPQAPINWKMISTIVSASCVFLIMLVAGGVLLYKKGATNPELTNGNGETSPENAPVEEYVADLESPIDSEDIMSIATDTPAKTVEQIEQEADKLLCDIKSYKDKEIIEGQQATIHKFAIQVQNSIADLDKKDFSASQEILNWANKSKSLADSEMNTLKQNVTNAKQKQKDLAKTKVIEKIQQANSIIKEYEKAQQEAQKSITEIEKNIQKIQNHINRLQEENKNQTHQTGSDSTQNTTPKEKTSNEDNESNPTTSISENNDSTGTIQTSTNQQNKNKNIIKKQITLRTNGKQHRECNLMDIFQQLDSAKCFNIKWQTTDDTVVDVIRFKGNVSIKGISKGQKNVHGEDDTNIYIVDVTVK